MLLGLIGPAASASDAVDAKLRVLVCGAGLAVTVMAGIVTALRWRWFGDARALWLAAAVGMLAIALLSELQVQLVQGLGVRPAAGVAAFATATFAVARAVRTDPVDALLRVGRVVGVVTTIWLVLAVGLTALYAGVAPPVWDRLATTATVALVVIGAITVRRGFDLGSALLAWVGVALVGCGLEALLAELAGAAFGAPAAGVRAIGLVLAAGGTTAALREAVAAAGRRVAEERACRERVEAERARAILHHRDQAHEARNALAALDGATSTLIARLHGVAERHDDGLEDALQAEIGRLRRMVGPGSDHAGAADQAQVIDLVALVRQRILLTSGSVPPPSLWVTEPALLAHGDADRVARILHNLLVNAQIHAGSCEPALVRVRRSADAVVVEVTDRGPGITPERRALLGRAPVDSRHGSGLGLYISSGLAQEDDGRLELINRVGGGTVATLTLPAATGRQSRRPSKDPVPTSTRTSARDRQPGGAVPRRSSVTEVAR